MSKEQADEPVLWFRPRISLSGTVVIPSNKSFKKFYESHTTPKLNKIDEEPSKKSVQISENKSEVQEILVMPTEKSSQSVTPQVIKKKRGRKPKNFNKSLEVPSTKPEAKSPELNSDQGKKNCQASESEMKKFKAKSDSAKKLDANGKYSSEAIVLIDDDPEPSRVNSKNKTNSKVSHDVGSSETSKKFAEFQKAVKNKLEKVKEQEKGLNGCSSSATQKKFVEEQKSMARPELPKKTKTNEPLGMSCPDPNCQKQFSDHSELIDHIKQNHLLQCKMPYCTFTTFTFQEYCEHFEQIHCANTILPSKRGPRVAEKEALPCKQAKINS